MCYKSSNKTTSSRIQDSVKINISTLGLTYTHMYIDVHTHRNSCFPIMSFFLCHRSKVPHSEVFLLTQPFELHPVLSPISFLRGRGSSFISKQTLHPPFHSHKKVLRLLSKLDCLGTILHDFLLLKQRRFFLQGSSYFVIHGSMMAPSKKTPTLSCQVSWYDLKVFLYMNPQQTLGLWFVFLFPTSFT